MQVTQRFAQLLIKNVGRVIVGKEDAVELMMIALLCRGHVLIEDVPTHFVTVGLDFADEIR